MSYRQPLARSRFISRYQSNHFSEHPQPGVWCFSRLKRSNRSRAKLVVQIDSSVAGQARQLRGGKCRAVNAAQPPVQQQGQPGRRLLRFHGLVAAPVERYARAQPVQCPSPRPGRSIRVAEPLSDPVAEQDLFGRIKMFRRGCDAHHFVKSIRLDAF